MNGTFTEQPVVFASDAYNLIGVFHHPANPGSTGVLVIVGGPQYRVGSHRQFVIMARQLAAEGIPVFRFDSHGMGDSEGEISTFDERQGDIKKAIDTFFEQCKTLKRVVLWGLCDGASAACFYAHKDKRIAGLVLVNPWVSEEHTQARTRLKHYYAQKLFEKGFWQKLMTGKVQLVQSFRELARTAVASRRNNKASGNPNKVVVGLRARMLSGLSACPAAVLAVVSGRDITAAEFSDLLSSSAEWQVLFDEGDNRLVRFPNADHTFSDRTCLNELVELTNRWVKNL